ncbi:MAG: hypothetical protein AB7F86_05255 [Bdellovibrionales bacterium]
MNWRFGRLAKIGFVLSLVSGWVLQGQACSPALSSKIGIPGKPSNNGGIYGGNNADTETYGPESSSGYYGPISQDQPANPTHFFVHHGTQPSQSCGPATPASAAFVSEWISIPKEAPPYYRSGYCGAPTLVNLAALNWVQYHPQVLVYTNQIFVFYEAMPNNPVDLKIPIYLCRRASMEGNFDVGTDVFVYKTKDGLFADFVKGELLAGIPTRTSVTQISVRETSGLVLGSGFSLDPATGTTSVDILTSSGATQRIEATGLSCISEVIPSPF